MEESVVTWREIKPGDVVHWCLGKPHSKHWVVLESRLRGDSSVRTRLLDLETGEVVRDQRDADHELLTDTWTVDRATLPSERSEKT
jgi:hypothetical protein